MPTEIVIVVEDKPGVVATIGEMFGEVGVNIIAGAAFTHAGQGILHFVVVAADRAIHALENAGFQVSQVREVLSVSIEDRPGEIGRYARSLADAGINITSFYTAASSQGDAELIIAVDNVEAARAKI